MFRLTLSDARALPFHTRAPAYGSRICRQPPADHSEGGKTQEHHAAGQECCEHVPSRGGAARAATWAHVGIRTVIDSHDLAPLPGSSRCDARQMGKRPSFADVVTERLRFLAAEMNFDGPEVQPAWDRIPAITRIRYHRGDVTIEVVHVIGFMGENYVETRYRGREAAGDGCWIELGRRTTHTLYQLRRAVELDAQAIRSRFISMPQVRG